MIWIHPDNIESGGKWVFPQYWNSKQPLWVIWYHGKLLIHHIAGLSLGFISSYWANEGIPAFQYDRKVLFPWYHLTQRSLLRISILRILIKVWKNFFRLIALKLGPGRSKMRKHNKNSSHSENFHFANFNIVQPTFTSAFNIVWIKQYHSTVQGCACLFYVNCELTL